MPRYPINARDVWADVAYCRRPMIYPSRHRLLAGISCYLYCLLRLPASRIFDYYAADPKLTNCRGIFILVMVHSDIIVCHLSSLICASGDW
eukprot:scaffold12299_cov85-Cyclotella_meneghiniana.AAC.5